MTSALNLAVEQAHARLSTITSRHDNPAFGTAFGPEGIVLLHMIATRHPEIAAFSLDTLLLPQATQDLWTELESLLQIPVRRVTPEPEALVRLERAQGRYGMYDSVESRRACCDIRKVQPLEWALAGHDAWITGVRRSHSAERAETAFEEFDQQRKLAKYNPLADWDDALVNAYLAQHALPVNRLHAKGYASIGCEPCTRALKPGEHPRAGRWWWEIAVSKECGLHGR
jgi:phosphoadenosine phosphosulfate reductase